MGARRQLMERTLDSFADGIVTVQRRLVNGVWRAVFDTGMRPFASGEVPSPDGYGATREEAAASCVQAIRDGARGIGAYASHSVLDFRLLRHWGLKERIERAGGDSNETVLEAWQAVPGGTWRLEGPVASQRGDARELELLLRVHLAEMEHAVQRDGADPRAAASAAGQAFAMEREYCQWHTVLRPEAWQAVEERFEDAARALGSQRAYGA